MTSRHIPVVGFVSLGCPKALVDTERIVTELRARGYRIGSTYKDADVVIVNTCGFVNEAVEESLGAIAEALKENGRVIVCGCLGGRTEADGSNFIMVRHPKVIGVTGPDSVDEVLAMVEGVLPRPHDPWDDLVPAAGVRLTPKHYAYLKISEGCNHHCTFCVIPHLRGSLNSRSMDSIIREAMNLKASGVKKWIASSEGFAKGILRIDQGAAAAVRASKAASILAVGVTAVEGDFERDDLVRILSPDGAQLAVGRISCDSATARRNIGRKGLKPLVHCDYLYLE